MKIETIQCSLANGLLCNGFMTSCFCLFGLQDHPEVNEPPQANKTNEPRDENEVNEPLDTSDPPEANRPQESIQ